MLKWYKFISGREKALLIGFFAQSRRITLMAVPWTQISRFGITLNAARSWGDGALRGQRKWRLDDGREVVSRAWPGDGAQKSLRGGAAACLVPSFIAGGFPLRRKGSVPRAGRSRREMKKTDCADGEGCPQGTHKFPRARRSSQANCFRGEIAEKSRRVSATKRAEIWASQMLRSFFGSSRR